MHELEVSQLKHGLYKIYWKSGGYSFAAVGSLPSGKRWLAPTNWVNIGTAKQENWDMVDSLVFIAGHAKPDISEEGYAA